VPTAAFHIAAILAQIAGGAPPPTTPPDGDAIAMVRSAPSNWAAYTFCNSAEWAALDAMYGTEAVNNMKNYYQGNYRMPGLPNPGDPNTMLREIGYVGLIRYYVMMNGTSVEDVGQADAQQVQVCGKPQPKLPCHA